MHMSPCMTIKDRILNQFGLQTRPTASDILLPAVGLVSAGAAVGAGVALLLAPKSGKQTRQDIADGAKAGATRVADAATNVASVAGNAVRKLPFVPSTPQIKPMDEMTKDELYARAQDLEIEGRSEMNKEELYEAVQVS